MNRQQAIKIADTYGVKICEVNTNEYDGSKTIDAETPDGKMFVHNQMQYMTAIYYPIDGGKSSNAYDELIDQIKLGLEIDIDERNKK